MKIGFIGLGQMGKPMAMNMLKHGGELIVHVRTARDPGFLQGHVRVTTDLREVAEGEIIFLCLPGSEAVQEALFGGRGLSGFLKKGQILVDLSTIPYAATLEIGERLQEQGVHFLDAPVSGMEARAREGTLTVMCGGSREVFLQVEPFLHWIGTKILYMGKAGSGQLTKLINQLLFNINAAALAEILPLSVKMGLDSEKVGEVINGGTGSSFASEFFIPRILDGNFSGGYSLENAYKDLVSAAETSARLQIPLPLVQAATTTYQMALLRGHGQQDKGAMIRVFEELLGVEYRKPGPAEKVGWPDV